MTFYSAIPGYANSGGFFSPTGSVGEMVYQSVTSPSAVVLTSGVARNITSLTLQPGLWDINGRVFFRISGVNPISLIAGCLSITSASLTLDQGMVMENLTAASPIDYSICLNLPLIRTEVTQNNTAIWYLNCQATCTSGGLAFGTIMATRVR